jgi:hypothetical protein
MLPQKILKKANVDLHTLSNYETVNGICIKEYITEEEQDTLKNGEKIPLLGPFPQ